MDDLLYSQREEIALQIVAEIVNRNKIRLYVKAYYHYKRLLAVDKYLRTAYQCASRLAKMQAENPQRFARLEANWQGE